MDGDGVGGACCASCAKGGPCEGGCPARDGGSCGCAGAEHAPEEPREAGAAEALSERHPIVAKARQSTGAHAVVSVEIPREAGSGDDDRDAFLRTIRGLPEAARADAFRDYMRQRGASQDAVNTGLLALARSGVDGLSTYFSRDFDRQMAAIREGNATERERIRQEGETARAELCYRYGGPSCGGAGTPAGSYQQQQPTQQQIPTQQPMQQQPMQQQGNDSLVMVLGLGLVAAVGFGLWSSSQKGR